MANVEQIAAFEQYAEICKTADAAQLNTASRGLFGTLIGETSSPLGVAESERALLGLLQVLAERAVEDDPPGLRQGVQDITRQLIMLSSNVADGTILPHLLKLSRYTATDFYTEHLATLVDKQPIHSRLDDEHELLGFQHVPEGEPAKLQAGWSKDLGTSVTALMKLEHADGPCYWPDHFCEIHIGTDLDSRVQLDRSVDGKMPALWEVRINEAMLACENGAQLLQATFKQKFDDYAWPRGLSVTFELLSTRTKEELIYLLLQSATATSRQTTIERVKRRRKQVSGSHLMLDLRDPVSKQPQQLPVRSEQCQHLETFCFLRFLESAPLDITEWRCPCTSQCGEIHPSLLHLDEWMLEVIHNPSLLEKAGL